MRAWKRLEKEYAQWWAMATMLVAVGATGQETSQPSPKKSRRITLANDEAKYASQAMLEFAGLDANIPRKGSLPDPIDTTLTSGPRKASPPDQFNSIGRYDLSKRQAEVLRNMLRSPKSAGRPGMGPRQTSALSTTSTGSSILPTQQVHSPSISLPSPGDSSYIPPTESFPLPPSLTAGVLSRPVPTKRRSSRGGLVGLKEFLRSLKSGSGASSSVKAPRRAEFPPAGLTCTRSTKRSESGVHLPSSNYANAATAAFPAPANPSFPRSASPASPTRPTFHPASRSSFFSALGPARPRDPSPTQEPIPTSRPTLRNIFRSSSGIWSDLIRGPPSQVPPLPTRNIARSSLEEEDTVDGLPIGPRRSPKRSKATRNLRQQADEEADHKIRGTVNKSRIVGLGWPEEPSPKLSSSPTWGQSSTALPEEIQLEHGDCQENLEEGMEEEDLAVMPEDLPVLLEYMRECEGKLGEWRRKVEELLV